MSQEITTSAKGLFTNPNYLDAPEGSLLVADNCVISRPGIIEPRRGYTVFNTANAYQHTAYWNKEPTGTLVGVAGDPSVYPLSFGWMDTTGVFHNTDNLDGRQQFFHTLAHDNNFYITSISGVLRQSNAMTGTSLYPAGTTPGFIFNLSASSPGSGSTIAPDCQVAYRTVWWFEDEAGVLHEGPPSGRVTYINQGVQIGPALMNVVNGTATFTPTGGHPFVSGQLVNLGESVLVEPNVPMGDYRVIAATGSLNFAINLGNGLTFTNKNVFRVANSARFMNVQVQVPREVSAHGAAAAASGTKANYYFQLYRSPASVESTVESSDEMGLVWESEPIAAFTGCALQRVTAIDPLVYVQLPGAATASISVGDYIRVPVDNTLNPYFVAGGYRVVALNVSGASFVYNDGVGGAGWNGGAYTQPVYSIDPWTYTVVDTVNDGLAGASLYTNPNQQGILQQNDAPPAANDIELFKNSVFYANTVSPYRANLQLNTVTASWIGGSPGPTSSNPDDGIFTGMSLYLRYYDGTSTWSWKYRPAIEGTGTENPNLGYYAVYPPQVYTDLSPAQAIEKTAQSLVGAINRDTRNKWVRAYYTSNADDIPGKITLEAKTVSTITAINQFWAQMGLVSGTTSAMVPSTVTASADIWPNGLFFSKEMESEAAPISNFFRVGENDKQILRIKALQNALVVVKEDGLFRIVGDGASNFRVEVLDNTIRCLAPETVDVMNNKLYAYTQYGVVEATEQGVQVISAMIDDQMKAIVDNAGLSRVFQYAFAVADPEDRKYKMWFPPADPLVLGCDSTFVYDFYTNAWTKWNVPARFATVDPNQHKLFTCDWTGFYSENKISSAGSSWKDYMDLFTTITAPLSGTGTLWHITGSVPVFAGDVVFIPASPGANPLSGTAYWVASSSWNGVAVSSTIQMHSTIPGSSTLSSTVYTHIPSLIGWTPKVGGNAGGVNQYREIGVAFRSGFFWDDEAVVGFIADYIANQTTGTSAGSVGIKGVSSYQLRPPDQNNQAFRVRVGVPRNQQRASELYIELDMGTAGNHFQIQNMSVTLNQVSEKQGRR